LVHTSSVVTVGASRRPTVLDECAVWNLASLRVPYIITKRLAEDVVLAPAAGPPEVVVVNPSCVIGPDDFSGSEFGTLCRRFWLGRIPVYFGGGLNVVDVRDVAFGHLLAAEHGRPGERYLLSGTNRSFGELFHDLARVAGRSIPRVRLPNALGVLGTELFDKRYFKKGRRPYLTAGQARMLGLYFFYDSAKARSELNYLPRSYSDTLTATHSFWTTGRAA
jgi:dihydroflavonol-4-reductase